MKEMVDKCLDSQLWHACAGSMVQIPPVNSKVFYFPQGHAEHSLRNVDFSALGRIPAMILCRVNAVKFLADPETDEIYAKIRLIPVENKEHDFGDDTLLGRSVLETSEKPPSSFSKTLTQSDANNGGGFSVPRYCAETIFPRLDFTADPPVQTVIAKDVHGEIWKFRHIYRGTPRRHLLTTGWSTFVNQKKLVAGDSVVFLRADNGDLCIGIRRVKRGGIGGQEPQLGWNYGAGSYGGSYAFLKDDENKMLRSGSNGNLTSPVGGFKDKVQVSPESVVKAAYLAANGQPFEIVYYPRASTPEFCVRASSVNAAMGIQWCSGMRFKMAFETEDSSRISWFMGSISSVQVTDPIRWPHSPWRLLQVTWDEPDLLHNVKNVSPWLVELVSNMPAVHLSRFSPPRKKLCLPQDLQFPLPSFSGNPLRSSSPFCCVSNITAGIQGARHAQFGVPLLDLHLSKKLQSGLLQPVSQSVNADSKIHKESTENISCLLTMGTSSQMLEKADDVKTPCFLLFGQPILTEQQIMKSEKFSLGLEDLSKSLSNATFLWNQGFHEAERSVGTGQCKVFLDSEDVGRTLDLSVLGSYEELYKRLANMFGIERADMMNRVVYRDATGASRQIGNEPFSEFMKTAKRLTILMNPGSSATRKWITDLPIAERCLDSSNQAGSLGIFA